MQLKPFLLLAASASACLCPGPPASAQQGTAPPPTVILNVQTDQLPKVPMHEVRIYTVTIAPGAASIWHTHPSPPFVYVVEGAIVLELEGRPPVEVRAGQALMEPMDIAMRGVNASSTELAKLILFYVVAPGMPFEVKQ